MACIACEDCHGRGQKRCETCVGLGTVAPTFHENDGSHVVVPWLGSTSPLAKRAEPPPAEPVVRYSAAIEKKLSAERELAKLADEVVRATGDTSPNAHRVACAKVLRTPKGREIFERYDSALAEAARAASD